MNDVLESWHAACNRAIASAEVTRVRQFGLRPVEPSDGLPGEIWAWKQASPAAPRSGGPVRAGFAGRRLHLGHLGLARTVAELARNGDPVLVFAAGARPDPEMTAGFLHAIAYFSPQPPAVKVVTEGDPDLRELHHQALVGLSLGRLGRLYGWDQRTAASVLMDLTSMLGFFFYSLDGNQGGVALLDTLQASHTALLARTSRALGTPAPDAAFRRLFPHLRAVGRRGSAREPSSVIFGDEAEADVCAKYLGAITGGRASIAEQRELGGSPERCAAFATVELLCAPEAAAAAAIACRSGTVTCVECKNMHVEAVAYGLRSIAGPLQPGHAAVSALVLPALRRAAARLHQLPPRDADRLEALIAEHRCVDARQVVVGHGSTEVADWLFALHARPGGQVVATKPTFELYGDLAARHGLDYRAVPWAQDQMDHDLPALARALDGDTRLVVLDIPHSVSGVASDPRHVLNQLTPLLPTDTAMLLDMVYADFMPNPPDYAALVGEYGNTVILGSLSKAHCLLGARIGFAIADARMAARLRACRLPFAMDSLALEAAAAALADWQQLSRTLEASRRARSYLTGLLDQYGLRYVPGTGNFLLIDLGRWHEHVTTLLAARVARFRDGVRFGLPGWIQVHLIDTSTIQPVAEAIQRGVSWQNKSPYSSHATDAKGHPIL